MRHPGKLRTVFIQPVKMLHCRQTAGMRNLRRGIYALDESPHWGGSASWTDRREGPETVLCEPWCIPQRMAGLHPSRRNEHCAAQTTLDPIRPHPSKHVSPNQKGRFKLLLERTSFRTSLRTSFRRRPTKLVANGLTVSGMSTDDSGMKLPRYVQQRPWGSYRYKHRVPKRLLSAIGKDHVYQNLGTNYRDMLRKLPAVNEAVEAMFSGIADAPTDDEKALALVKAHYGEKAAYDLGIGQLDQDTWDGLLDLYDRLEDKIDPNVHERILSAEFPSEVLSLSAAFGLYARFKDVPDNKKLANSLTKAQGDLKAAIGAVKSTSYRWRT